MGRLEDNKSIGRKLKKLIDIQDTDERQKIELSDRIRNRKARIEELREAIMNSSKQYTIQ